MMLVAMEAGLDDARVINLLVLNITVAWLGLIPFLVFLCDIDQDLYRHLFWYGT